MPAILLTTDEAASYLGLSASTLEKARVAGTGAAYIKLGRAVRYRAADLDAFLSQHTIRSTSEERS